MCQTKVCTNCKEEKSSDSFRKRPSLKTGLHSWCRLCENIENRNRYEPVEKVEIVLSAEEISLKELIKKTKTKERMLMRRYNLSIYDYEKMYLSQNKCCKICNIELPLGTLKGLYVDHCHKTGKVRGLLCRGCNFTLGIYKDNIEMFINFIKYLKEK